MKELEQEATAPWASIVHANPELSDNPEGALNVVERLEGQYLPACMKARTEEQQERVWLAFWSYLTARITRRKPFEMSSRAADELITEIKKALVSQTS